MAEFEVQIKEENLVFRKSPVLTDKVMHYCPGCSHGTVHNLVAEVIEDLGIQDKTIGVSPVGCSVFAYNYLHIDWSQAAHGRACAVATAIKRTNPDKMVFTYQGDGDLASIGTAGIPSVGLVTLAMVLNSVGLPTEGIALIMGIDRILDMLRTAVNITGDAVCTTIVSHQEKALNREVFNRN